MLAKLRMYLKFKPYVLLARWRHSLIGKYATAVLTETANGLILAPATDFFIGRKLAHRGGANRHLVEKLLTLLDASSDILIVGAHIGTILIPLAKKCRSAVGIEANPRVFNLLEMNVLLNRLDNVQVINVAASDEAGELQFVANTVNTGGSKVDEDLERRYEFFYDNPDIVTVRSEKLDELLKGRSFDLVVLDIEGSEYKALKGMHETLAKTKYLVVEVTPNHVENVAGVSKEEFIKVIPERFSQASYFGGQDGRSYSRSEFIDLLDQIWKEFRGADLLFVAEKEAR